MFWWTFALFFLTALTEMFFPPFPGDTVYFVGLVGVSAVEGSVVGALAATFLGGVIGFGALYWLGRAKGRRLFSEERTGILAASSLRKVEQWFRRWGSLVTLASRFLPGIRSVVPLAAGVGAYPASLTLVLGAFSIILWNGLLAVAALLLHENWATVSYYWNTYSVIFWAVGAIVLVAVVWRATRRRNHRRN
jgi:membrane protein DedA with SNARE-associated domain